jgi:Fe-S-cluster containining protein
MKKLHAEFNDKIFVPKEGQRDFACSNKKSYRCPFLGVKTKEEKVELVKPILKNLINFIIEKEIEDYLDKLYANQTGKIKCIDI